MIKDMKYKSNYYCINTSKEIYSEVLYYFVFFTFAVVLTMGF